MLKQYGRDNSLALGWRDRNSQLIRFDALATIADLNGKTILDAGCGHGDLFAFLLERYPDIMGYCGVDFIPEMITAARSRFTSPTASFWPVSFMSPDLPVHDYVLASGSLNYASADPAYIYKAINRLFELSRFGIGFNLLRKVPYEGLLVAYDPQDIVASCRTLSDNVVLVDDYDTEDFTVFVYR
ncbi:class I SAM-dependent methyltransferase [Mucilaginibacter corticis]|nr:class I SAM-dependent methyltransferase [Mucilaginibacter corticis]